MKHVNVRDQRGFSLLEVIITLLVLGVVGAFVARPLIGLIQTRTSISEAAEQQGNRDYAVTRIAKDIRLSAWDEPMKTCTANEMEIGDTLYEYNTDAQVLRVNGDVLVEGVSDFECDEQYATLRLYTITLDGETFRAFKREHP